MIEDHYWSTTKPPAGVEIPASVEIVSTTRRGGVSSAPYDTLNLGTHVGDDPSAVRKNRRLLRVSSAEKPEFCWLTQVHGIDVVDAAQVPGVESVEADASFTRTANVACAVMTADCLPVLLFDRLGTVVAAAHAGWRGLVAGVVEETIDAMAVEPAELVALLGPAIGPDTFEVGDEVRQAFVEADSGADACFRPSPFHPEQRWVADLYELCRRRLRAVGIGQVVGGDACTFSDEERFYSYRRDGQTGRMASAIWLRRNVRKCPDR